MRKEKSISVRVRAPSRGLVTRLPSESADLVSSQGPLGLGGLKRAAAVAQNVRYEEGVVCNAPGHQLVVPQSPLLSGVVSHWRLNETQGARLDATPNKRDLSQAPGTYWPGVRWAPGKLNKAAQFPARLVDRFGADSSLQIGSLGPPIGRRADSHSLSASLALGSYRGDCVDQDEADWLTNTEPSLTWSSKPDYMLSSVGLDGYDDNGDGTWWDMHFYGGEANVGDYQVAKWVKVCGGLYGGRTLHISGQWSGDQRGFIDTGFATSLVKIYLDSYEEASLVVGGGGYTSFNTSPLATPQNPQDGPLWGQARGGGAPSEALVWSDISLPAGQHRLLVLVRLAMYDVAMVNFAGEIHVTTS